MRKPTASQKPKTSDYPDVETDAQLPAIILFESFLCSLLSFGGAGWTRAPIGENSPRASRADRLA
jgi:hypothetical protein